LTVGIVALLWTILGLSSLHYGSSKSLFTFSTTATSQQAEQLPFPESARKLWRELLPLLEDTAPGVQSPTIADGTSSVHWNVNEELELQDQAVMHHRDVLVMARQHRRFTTEMSTRISPYVPSNQAERRGIVTVAGGDYLPAAVVTLRMLRRTGSTLPVEIWMADETEYEPEICEDILVQYNARCRLLSDVFNHATNTSQSQKIAHFQYKIFAILFSTFDEVLFLDSDDIPLHDPQELFDSDLFKEKGMIVWPDLWATSISPVYYLIADQPAPPSSLRASTESGQLLVNKLTHYPTLIMTAYYNYYGPDHYYLLLCQGGYGRGDKSTFVPAALAMTQSFYDVAERPVAIGQDHEWLHVFALIQFDPLQDYSLTSRNISRARNASAAPPIRPFFLHGNDPKWNGERIFSNADYDDHGAHGFRTNPTRNPAGEPSWAYVHPVDAVAHYGIRAIERQLWEQTRWVSCTLERAFKIWKDKTEICKRVEDWFGEFLDTPAAALGDDDDDDAAVGQHHGIKTVEQAKAEEVAEEEKARHAAGLAESFGRIAAIAAAAAEQGSAEEKASAEEDIKKILEGGSG